MPRLSRAKLLQLRGLALLVLLAAGVIGQPLIDRAGELHESVLHADAGETYTHPHDHSAAHHDETPGGSGQEPGGPLHPLLHTPCGGHCVLITAAQVVPVLHDAINASVPDESTLVIPPSDYTAPFRPPIAA